VKKVLFLTWIVPLLLGDIAKKVKTYALLN